MTEQPLPAVSARDTARVVARVLLPLIAQGAIKRRPRAVAAAAQRGADARAGEVLRDLRERYGPGPLRLRVPGRPVVIPVAGHDVARILAAAPEPFDPAAREKRAALAHFQPNGVLISRGTERRARRAFVTEVLETDRRVHALAPAWATMIGLEATTTPPVLGWDEFNRLWWRIVRRVTLGDGARDDDAVTDELARLRRSANWAYLHPTRRRLRASFTRRIEGYLRRAEPGSLAGVAAVAGAAPDIDPAGQIPHWLFAFDAAGIAAFRTLALLSTHSQKLAGVRAELADRDRRIPQDLPYLRACVLEAVRLWPTTLVVLRDTTQATDWRGHRMPPGATVVIVSSFFHRDPALEFADRFAPEIWCGDERPTACLIPFSAGPARCPGRNVVEFVTSTLLSHLVTRDWRLENPGLLDPDRPLPPTLDHFHLRLMDRTAAPR